MLANECQRPSLKVQYHEIFITGFFHESSKSYDLRPLTKIWKFEEIFTLQCQWQWFYQRYSILLHLPQPRFNRAVATSASAVRCSNHSARSHLVLFLRHEMFDIVLCTATKSHLCIHRKELCGISSNFHIHVSVGDLYIPGSVHIFSCSRISRPIMGTYKSLTDIWMGKLGLRLRNSISGNIFFEFSVLCLCSVVVWHIYNDPGFQTEVLSAKLMQNKKEKSIAKFSKIWRNRGKEA